MTPPQKGRNHRLNVIRTSYSKDPDIGTCRCGWKVEAQSVTRVEDLYDLHVAQAEEQDD